MGLINQSGLFSGAGLVDQAGLYNEAGLYVPGSFSPLSLNPLLAYEAESSMIAPFEQPTLDLDPSNPSSLDIITATRAGVATYTDADGVIQTASPNTVRVDHVDGVPMILVEPAATNLIASTDFTSQGSASIVSGIDAPDGSNNARRVSDIQLAAGDRASSETASISPSTQYTGSLYVRGTAGETISVYAKRVSGTYVGSQNVQVILTGEWQRVTDLTFITLADNTGVKVLLANNGTSDTADVVDIWGAQLEEGPVSTSYIPTSGSTVTRNADQLVIEGSDFTDFYNQSEGTVYFEGNCKSRSDPRLFEFSDGTASNRTRIDINNGTGFRILVYSGSMIVNEEVPFTGASSLFRTALSFKVNDLEGSLNGQSVINETPSSLPTLNQLHVGSNHDGTAAYLNGHIKRIIYWPYHSDDL